MTPMFLMPLILGDEVPTSLMQFILSGGGTAVLLVVCWLWLTGRIVTRRELDLANQNATYWRDIAFKSVNNNERVTTATEKITNATAKAIEASPTFAQSLPLPPTENRP